APGSPPSRSPMRRAAPCATTSGTPPAASAVTQPLPTCSENMAEVYAPIAMKPACPMENCPVKPLMRLSDTASTMLIPHSTMICRTYGLTTRGMTSWMATSAASVAVRPARRFTSDLLGRVAAEDAGGTEEQDGDQEHERDGVAPRGR